MVNEEEQQHLIAAWMRLLHPHFPEGTKVTLVLRCPQAGIENVSTSDTLEGAKGVIERAIERATAN
jgi:hypothetical protein